MTVAARCVRCDRPACGHADAIRYSFAESDCEHVETETGEKLRQYAVALLTHRYRVLAERSKAFAFSPGEGTVMEATGRALDALSAMTPAGPLVPADSKAWWAEALRA